MQGFSNTEVVTRLGVRRFELGDPVGLGSKDQVRFTRL